MSCRYDNYPVSTLRGDGTQGCVYCGKSERVRPDQGPKFPSRRNHRLRWN